MNPLLRCGLLGLTLALAACAGLLGIRPRNSQHPFEHRAHALAGVTCVTCHAGTQLPFAGSAEEVYDRVMARAGVVDLENPTASLLYAKPTASVAHGGQKIFETDSAQADAIIAWIEGGAEL